MGRELCVIRLSLLTFLDYFRTARLIDGLKPHAFTSTDIGRSYVPPIDLVNEESERSSRQTTDASRESIRSSVAPRVLTAKTGTLLWRAPEVSAGTNYSLSADVYALGIILWEIMARQLPFNDIAFDWEIIESVSRGVRPPIDPSWSQTYCTLMSDCWTGDPWARPTAQEVERRLKVIKAHTQSF